MQGGKLLGCLQNTINDSELVGLPPGDDQQQAIFHPHRVLTDFNRLHWGSRDTGEGAALAAGSKGQVKAAEALNICS